MVPDLRIEEHGRIRELVHGRVALVTVAVVLALAPLPVRGQEVKSVEGGHCRGRSLPVCGLVEIGRGLITATALNVCALILGETGLRDRSRRDRSRSSDRYRSRRQRTRPPTHRGGRGHAISRFDLMTARGHAIDDLPPLTARGLERKDG